MELKTNSATSRQGRPARVGKNKTIQRNVWIPLELSAKVDAFLYSDLEQRIPHGAFSDFMNRAARHYLEYLGGSTEEGTAYDY